MTKISLRMAMMECPIYRKQYYEDLYPIIILTPTHRQCRSLRSQFEGCCMVCYSPHKGLGAESCRCVLISRLARATESIST